MANADVLLMFAADDDEFEEELFEDEDLNMLFAAVGPFTRRQLNRVKGYFEVTVPTYAPYEFQLAGNVAIKCLGFEHRLIYSGILSKATNKLTEHLLASVARHLWFKSISRLVDTVLQTLH